MILVCDAQKTALEEAARSSTGVPEPISEEIVEMLKDKDYAQLLGLQKDIQAKLSSGEPVDVEYWEQVLKQLVVKMAKVR